MLCWWREEEEVGKGRKGEKWKKRKKEAKEFVRLVWFVWRGAGARVVSTTTRRETTLTRLDYRKDRDSRVSQVAKADRESISSSSF
jgi:hypothetical protein